MNPKDFEYGIDGVEAIKRNKANLNVSGPFLKSGFLHEYASSSLVTDITSF